MTGKEDKNVFSFLIPTDTGTRNSMLFKDKEIPKKM
jgi:hypothetical protein